MDNMIRSGYEKNKYQMLFLWKNISMLVKSKKIEIQVLLKDLQIQLEQNASWLLEGQRNSIGSKKEYVQKSCRCFGNKQSEMEGWQKNRQRWIHPNLESSASLRRLSWVCSRTSPDCGKEYWTYIAATGSNTS